MGSSGGCSATVEKYFWMPFLGLDLGASKSAGASSSISDGAGDSEDKDERSEESSSADILRAAARCCCEEVESRLKWEMEMEMWGGRSSPGGTT